MSRSYAKRLLYLLKFFNVNVTNIAYITYVVVHMLKFSTILH
jgi:hypothetical protein